jgi:hypothetical protein
MKPKQFMQWWQHFVNPYTTAMLPRIQWQINPPPVTLSVQWPEWLQPQHTPKIMIHLRAAADTNLQYIKYFTSLPTVVLKSSAIIAEADLGPINGIQLAVGGFSFNLVQ